MKKALLAVSFGTSYMDTFEKTIRPIEEDLREAFPDRTFYRAFTSGMIIRKLKKQGLLEVDTVEEALDRALAEGAEDILVQTTHIINGEEYDLLRESIEKKAGAFAQIHTGKPLLTDHEDYPALARAVLQEVPAKREGECLIFMGHGSTHYANAAYAQLEYVFHDLGRSDVYIGTVEGYPQIDEVIRRLQEHGEIKKASCYPLLIVAGDHARNDMSGEGPDSWKSQLRAQGYETSCILKGLGEYENVRRIFAEHARKALEKE